jgi:hypothetical protein
MLQNRIAYSGIAIPVLAILFYNIDHSGIANPEYSIFGIE